MYKRKHLDKQTTHAKFQVRSAKRDLRREKTEEKYNHDQSDQFLLKLMLKLKLKLKLCESSSFEQQQLTDRARFVAHQ